MERIVIIGSGNLAEALVRAIAASEMPLVQLFARNTERGPALAKIAGAAWSDNPSELAEADIYLIAVSDKAVAHLAATLPIPSGAIVAHTAGSVPLNALPAKFARRAVLYPLQTFTKGREVDFQQVPIFIETSTEGVRSQFEAFASKLSSKVIYANSAQRIKIHMAGVFACNFANHMYAIGARIVHDAGLPFDVLKPLITETAAKACDAPSPINVQTGPAVRNDFETKARHSEMLSFDLRLKNIYSTISQSIWETSKKI